MGRDSIGIDLNPIGVLISRVKTYLLTREDELFFEEFKKSLKDGFIKNSKSKFWVPDIPKIDHWFVKEAILGLSMLVHTIRKVESVERRRVLNLVLSNIIVGVSNQESETRFAARQKEIKVEDVLRLYLIKLDLTVKKLSELATVEKIKGTTCKVFLDSTLNLNRILDKNSVDLIVTSPPYLNSFDYYLYHKFRVFWLSYPENLSEVFAVTKIQEEELGSRYKYSGGNRENLSVFTGEMKECFRSFNNVLKPSKMLFLVVGDSILKGSFLQMDKFYESIAAECGFNLVSKISYPMSSASRSFISTNTVNVHYSKKETHILAFQSLNTEKESQAKSVNIPATFETKQAIEVEALPAKIKTGDNFLITSDKVTDFTHGLVKYPAKYIPQIPAWAIKNYSKEGDLVLDPFNGSGTTSVECLLNGRSFIGIDINPMAILASDVKTTFLQKSEIEKEIEHLKRIIGEKIKSGKYKKVSFDLQDFWFNNEAINEFFILKSSIDEISNAGIRKLMLVSLSSIVKRISYLDESQLKVKRDHKKLLNGKVSPFEIYFKRLERDSTMIQSLQNVHSTGTSNIHICGSAFQLDSGLVAKNTVDLIVTSPPYINAMNYPMYHRYELLLLELIHPDNYIGHQEQYIGTERVYASAYKSFQPFRPDSKDFVALNRKLQEIFDKEPKRYFITRRFFEEMFLFYEQAYKILKKGKRIIVVCGQNTIKGVPIDTSLELAKIGQAVGFKEDFHFTYEIRKHRFKLTRHETAGKINTDVIVVMKK